MKQPATRGPPVPISGEGIDWDCRPPTLRSASPEYLAKSGQRIWGESVNPEPPISGGESLLAIVPIYFPITEQRTLERTPDGTATG